MGGRKTAYLATISSIEDIEGKDKIKYISLKDLGWQVIGSSDLRVDQRVVYIEYDTIISEEQIWAEFLRKRCYSAKFRGFRISAMKMAGVISYGLVLTLKEAGLDSLYEIKPDGTDLSGLLKVFAIDDAVEYEQKPKKEPTKIERFFKKYFYFLWKAFFYRKPTNSQFPSNAAIKTDETRIQNLTYLFDQKFENIPLYVTEKLDGSSATFSIFKNRFIISSRNVKQYDQPLKKAIRELTKGNAKKLGRNSGFVEIACIYNIPYHMKKFMNSYHCGIYAEVKEMENLTIQGELCGPGIQKNKLKLNTNTLFIFNLFDPDTRKYYDWNYVETFSTYSFIPHVPLKELTNFKWKNIKEMEEYVNESFDTSLYPKDQPREGLVFRARDPSKPFLPDAEKNQNGCFSWKCISPQYILQNSN